MCPLWEEEKERGFHSARGVLPLASMEGGGSLGRDDRVATQDSMLSWDNAVTPVLREPVGSSRAPGLHQLT